MHLGLNVFTISVMATSARCLGIILSGFFVFKTGSRWIQHISTLLVAFLSLTISVLLWSKETHFGENFFLSVIVLVNNFF